MKILLFTLEYPPFKGGVAGVYGNIVKHWPEKGNIFTLRNDNGELISEKSPFLKWWPAVFRLLKTVKRKKIDHIFVGHILPLGTVACLTGKLTKIPYSVFLHGMDFAFALKTPRKRWMAKIILKNARNIICMNGYVAGLVREFAPTEATKIEVVNPGIDKELRITNYELRIKLLNKYSLENKIVLLSVGRFVERKGFDKVIKALPGILKEVPNLIYVIVGNGRELPNYESQIANRELNDNVVIITNADDEEKNAWYEICDIFIMPSRNMDGDFEGFGIVYLEANLAGKPVIAGNGGGVRDAVKDGLNGLLVNPEDVGEIQSAIIKLAKDGKLRGKLGEQGKKRAIKEFSWDKQAKKIHKIVSRKFNRENLKRI